MKDLGSRSRVSDSSATVVKKKTSSGCLVIKKNNTKEDYYYENKDVYEFDEYDDDRIRKDGGGLGGGGGGYRWKTYTQSGSGRMERGVRTRYAIDDDDECDLPLSVLRSKSRLASGKSIRLQGKNGVLKVMVNKSKRMGGLDSRYDRAVGDNAKELEKVLRRDGRDGRSSVKLETRSSFDSDYKSSRKALGASGSRGNSVGNEAYEDFKSGRKALAFQRKEKPRIREECVKDEGSFVKKVSGMKGKESKVSRVTEKQIMREKIKDMLVGGGWTIDYRPRRNRDYMDAVYISPSGSGYWSIIKAYDAFQKEEGGCSRDGGGNIAPLRDEVVGIFSRQTHQRYESEMLHKRKFKDDDDDNDDDDDDEEKLNLYGRKSRKIGRCSLLVRGNDDGFVAYSGRRTLLSWLIDSGVVQMREHVEYMNRRKTQILQKGRVTDEGIHCGCCSKIVSVLKFEAHAGSKLEDPFRNIFMESGKSLMQCQIDAWNKLGELERKGFYTVDTDGDDPNDDTCGLCGDGGDLICCDGCPSTFHQTCLDLPMLPQGDWFCQNCSCRYCEIASTNLTQASLLTCYLCQKKYHESCRLEIDVKHIESDYPNLSFCGHTCHELYSQLQKLFGVKHRLDSGFSWSLIHRSELPMDASSVQLSQQVEHNSMLAVAMSVMDECFLPFTDRRSGINLIRNVVFNCGSNLSRINFSGFFTAILKRGDEVICAASIRIHGTRLAEMPFIGTRHIYRRQGMCRRLLSAIEMALSSLQVEKLIIPAVPEHMDTWTDVFGFHQLEESEKKELRSVNMLVFPRTDMLQKQLVKVKTDSGSREPLDDASTTPCEPTLSGSVDAHLGLETNVDESTVQVADGLPSSIICKPELQLHSNTKLEETEAQNVISLTSNNRDKYCESLSLDANITTAVEESPSERDLSAET